MSKVTFDASEKYEQGRKAAIAHVQYLRSRLNELEEMFWARKPTEELADTLTEIVEGVQLLGMSYGLLAYNEALEKEYGQGSDS